MTEPDPLLRLANLSKSFGGLKAVSNLDMPVFPGEITALIGPNGAGKTTVFNCITGFTRADEGNILFRNGTRSFDLKRLPPDRIVDLGLARTFQNIRLFPNLSVIDHIKLGYFLRLRKGLRSAVMALFSNRADREAETVASSLIDFVGLADVWMEKPGALPFGHQRKLELARALATQPKILLLDEPASGMNTQESQELKDLVERIRDTCIAVLLIEHDMNVVMGISDRITVLDYGIKIADGSPAEIRSNEKVIQVYLGHGPADACAGVQNGRTEAG